MATGALGLVVAKSIMRSAAIEINRVVDCETVSVCAAMRKPLSVERTERERWCSPPPRAGATSGRTPAHARARDGRQFCCLYGFSSSSVRSLFFGAGVTTGFASGFGSVIGGAATDRSLGAVRTALWCLRGSEVRRRAAGRALSLVVLRAREGIRPFGGDGNGGDRVSSPGSRDVVVGSRSSSSTASFDPRRPGLIGAIVVVAGLTGASTLVRTPSGRRGLPACTAETLR